MNTPPPLPARFRQRMPVRFRDLDPLGHAHHTLPLIYVEEARARYWREVVGRESLDEIDYVIAEVHVRYHARIAWPASVEVALRVTRIGTKSFQMVFAVTTENGELLASGDTTQVMFDYAQGTSIRIPDDVRSAIESFEREAAGT